MTATARLVSRSPRCSAHARPATAIHRSPSREQLVPPANGSRQLAARLDLRVGREGAHALDADRDRPRIAPLVCVQRPWVMVLAVRHCARPRSATAAHPGPPLTPWAPPETRTSPVTPAGRVWGRELAVEATKVAANAGIRAYVPLTDFAPRTDFSGHDDVGFDQERDEDRCPQGHPLRRDATKRTEGVGAYRAEATVGNACPLKPQGTTRDHGRTGQRSVAIDDLEQVRGDRETEAYQKAIRKRQVWVEPMVAAAKEWYG